ncbi:MAG: endonuclease [Acholeplasmatales bacterium]|jgi:endonuclease I|nr:endonuclease [Acholeplasmatales bacterium]
MRKIFSILFISLVMLLSVACSKNSGGNEQSEYWTVTIITRQQTFSFNVTKGTVVQQLPDDFPADANLIGFTDEQGEWFDLFVSPITQNITLNAIYETTGGDILYQFYFHRQDVATLSGGTSLLNGLTWTYSAFSFLGDYTFGIQIGSKNSPQLTPWTITTSLPSGTKIKAYEVGLCTASAGVATWSVSISDSSTDYHHGGSINSINEISYYGESNLSLEATSFSLSLSASARAIYFESVRITLDLPEGHNLNIIGGDTILDLPPVSISLPKLYSLDEFNSTNYYASINNLTGETLFQGLRSIISNMTKRSYGEARYILQYTDEDILHTGYDYGLYDGDLIKATWDSGATWNREHVWACSQMKLTSQDRPDEETKNHTSDLHNLRVACGPTNGHHGDKFFDEVDGVNTIFPNIVDNGNIPGTHNDSSLDDHRGDIARILFYMYTRYDGLRLTEETFDINDRNMGRLSALRRWNLEDPVDEFEIQRNNRIYEYQGNRNPFIDDSHLIEVLFESYGGLQAQSLLNNPHNPYLNLINFFKVTFTSKA